MVGADDIAGVAEAVMEEGHTKAEEGQDKEEDDRASEDEDDEDDGELDKVAAVEDAGSGTRRTPTTTADKNAGSRGG
jgi:hypothetical protein